MSNELNKMILESLDDLKAQDVVTLDVRELTDVTDTLIIATGTSNRHVKSLAQNAVDDAKKKGQRAIGVEGQDAGEWVLADFGDTILHVMLPATRSNYDLEKLWTVTPAGREEG